MTREVGWALIRRPVCMLRILVSYIINDEQWPPGPSWLAGRGWGNRAGCRLQGVGRLILILGPSAEELWLGVGLLGGSP